MAKKKFESFKFFSFRCDKKFISFLLMTLLFNYFLLILLPFSFGSGIISLCWLFGSIIGFMPVFGWHNDGYQDLCLFTHIMDYNYLVFLYFTTIITPSLILAVFYGLIYRVILQQVSTCARIENIFRRKIC